MNLDDVALALRTREEVRIPLSELPLLETDAERVLAARRLIRQAGKEIGAKVKTMHVDTAGFVIGWVDRERSDEETQELLRDAMQRLQSPKDDVV